MGTLVGGTLGSSLGRTWPAAHLSEDRLRVCSSAVARWRRLRHGRSPRRARHVVAVVEAGSDL